MFDFDALEEAQASSKAQPKAAATGASKLPGQAGSRLSHAYETWAFSG